MLSGQQPQQVIMKQTEIDFGSTPTTEAEFTIGDESVLVTSRLTGTVSYEAPTGKDQDELTMDALDLKFAPGDKFFTLYAKADGSNYVADKFKINYQISN